MNLSTIAKKLGSKGGRARAKVLDGRARRRIASSGGKARAKSLQAKRLILENFSYLEAVQALSPPPPLKRRRDIKHRLPGLHGSETK